MEPPIFIMLTDAAVRFKKTEWDALKQHGKDTTRLHLSFCFCFFTVLLGASFRIAAIRRRARRRIPVAPSPERVAEEPSLLRRRPAGTTWGAVLALPGAALQCEVRPGRWRLHAVAAAERLLRTSAHYVDLT